MYKLFNIAIKYLTNYRNLVIFKVLFFIIIVFVPRAAVESARAAVVALTSLFEL